MPVGIVSPVKNQQAQNKFWNFIVNQATEITKENVELRIEGDFIDSEDAWIYEWYGIPVASPNAFRKELANYEGKNIKVWINSYGGSVFAATGIYNALMEHKTKGAKVVCIADGKIMSAATIPFMAGDERLMSPGAIYMMHNPLTGVYGYASDLRKTADVLEEVKESIINAYQKGTGRDRAEISQLMDNETYMSATTAVKEGFATGILYSEVENHQQPVMNFMFNRLAIQNITNDSIKKLFDGLKVNSEIPETPPENAGVDIKNTIQKGDMNDMEIKNVEELKAAFPELVKSIENAAETKGAETERARMKSIDEISNTLPLDLVNKAKYDEIKNAESLAFEALKKNTVLGTVYNKDRAEELKNSGAEGVQGDGENVPDEKLEEDAAIENMVNFANSKKR